MNRIISQSKVLHCGNMVFRAFCYNDLDLDLEYEPDPYPFKMYLQTKNELSTSRFSKSYRITDRKTCIDGPTY